MKKLYAVLVSIICAGCLLTKVYAAGVVIQDTGDVKDTAAVEGNELTRITRNIAIRSGGAVPYILNYRRIPGPEITGDKIEKPLPEGMHPFPWLGDRTAGSLGIGLTGSAWYKNGFLGVRLDGRGVNAIADEIISYGGEDRGGVEFSWDEEWGSMKLKFVQLAGDDKLFAEIRFTGIEDKTALIRMLSFPGHWGSAAVPADRWGATAARSVQGNNVLDVSSENWILSFDANDNTRGSAALLFLPEQVEKAELNVSGAVWKHLTLKKGQNSLRMILWSLPDSHKTPEQAYPYLSANAAQYAETLRGFEF